MNNYLFWKRFAQGKLKTHVSSAKIRIPSPKEILSWSERRLPNSTLIGKIDNAHTVEHDTLRPVSGGLFCERIFGPIATNVCACLRRKGWNEDYCKICEVQFTKSRLRRYQMGHILLAAPVIHIWALQGGYLANLLGKKNLGIRSIAYGKVMCQSKLWKNTISNKDYELTREAKLNNKNSKSNVTLALTRSALRPTFGWALSAQQPKEAAHSKEGFVRKRVPNITSLCQLCRHSKPPKAQLRMLCQDPPLALTDYFRNQRFLRNRAIEFKELPSVAATKGSYAPLAKGFHSIEGAQEYTIKNGSNKKEFCSNGKIKSQKVYERGNILPFHQFLLYKPDTFNKITQFFNSLDKKERNFPLPDYSKQKLTFYSNSEQSSKAQPTKGQVGLPSVVPSFGSNYVYQVPFESKIHEHISYLKTVFDQKGNISPEIQKKSIGLLKHQSFPMCGVNKESLNFLLNQRFHHNHKPAATKRFINCGFTKNKNKNRNSLILQTTVLQPNQKDTIRDFGVFNRSDTLNWGIFCFYNELPVFKLLPKLTVLYKVQTNKQNNFVVVKSSVAPYKKASDYQRILIKSIIFHSLDSLKRGALLGQSCPITPLILTSLSKFAKTSTSHRKATLASHRRPLEKKEGIYKSTKELPSVPATKGQISYARQYKTKFCFVPHSLEQSTNYLTEGHSYIALLQTQSIDRNKDSKAMYLWPGRFARATLSNEHASNSNRAKQYKSTCPKGPTFRQVGQMSYARLPKDVKLVPSYLTLYAVRSFGSYAPYLTEGRSGRLGFGCCAPLAFGSSKGDVHSSYEVSVGASICTAPFGSFETKGTKGNYALERTEPQVVTKTKRYSATMKLHPYQKLTNIHWANRTNRTNITNIASLCQLCRHSKPPKAQLRMLCQPKKTSFGAMEGGNNKNQKGCYLVSATEDQKFKQKGMASLTFKKNKPSLIDIKNIAYTGSSILFQNLKNFNLVLLDSLISWKWKRSKIELNKFLLQNKLTKKKRNLRNKLAKTKIVLTKRKNLVQSFLNTKQLPEWMIISILPILPPALRPILELEPNNVVVSDLNVLYQTVIRRNDALMGLLSFRALEIDILNRQVSLQQAIEKLFDKGAGTKKRPVKSLSQGFHGKKGLFRSHLLGKRVDYSGRSVIVVGPQLKLHECGLPKEMALVLFLPFLIARLKKRKVVANTSQAKQLILHKDKQIWSHLKSLIYEHPVLLNRAPTLHRLGFQAFQPILVSGKAMILPALVCTGFNADFDGDQMAVHVPLSHAARAESWKLLHAKNNMLSPATGKPIVVLSQEMILGCYCSTLILNKTHLNVRRQIKAPTVELLALDPKEATHSKEAATYQRTQGTGNSSEGTHPKGGALHRSINKFVPKDYFRMRSNQSPTYLTEGRSGRATFGCSNPNQLCRHSKRPLVPKKPKQAKAQLRMLCQDAKQQTPSLTEGNMPSSSTFSQERSTKFVGHQRFLRTQTKPTKNFYFTTFQEIYKALGSNKIAIQTAVWLRIPFFEDNQFLEEPLEIRLDAIGHFFRSYCQSQRHFSKNVKSQDQTKGISYIRTSAGRIQLNETFYSSWS